MLKLHASVCCVLPNRGTRDALKLLVKRQGRSRPLCRVKGQVSKGGPLTAAAAWGARSSAAALGQGSAAPAPAPSPASADEARREHPAASMLQASTPAQQGGHLPPQQAQQAPTASQPDAQEARILKELDGLVGQLQTAAPADTLIVLYTGQVIPRLHWQILFKPPGVAPTSTRHACCLAFPSWISS